MLSSLADDRVHEGYVEVGRVRMFRAPLELHWSLILATLAIALSSQANFLGALVSFVSYMGILLIHESGHAWVAQRLGYRVRRIRLALFHGSCAFDAPHTEWDDLRITWGGVAAQLLVAVPVIAIGQLAFLRDVPLLDKAIVFLGPVNVFIAALNLVPYPGLDGATAWFIVPPAFRRLSARMRARPPRKKSNLRVLK